MIGSYLEDSMAILLDKDFESFVVYFYKIIKLLTDSEQRTSLLQWIIELLL